MFNSSSFASARLPACLVVTGALTMLVVAVMSCRPSDERKVVDWYQEARTVMADQTPGARGCEQHRHDLYSLGLQIDNLIETNQAISAQTTRMKQLVPPSGHRALDADANAYAVLMSQAIDELFDSFEARTGLDSDDLHYCIARLDAQDNHSRCEHILLPGAGFADYGRFGYAEYCIENRIPPYDNPR